MKHIVNEHFFISNMPFRALLVDIQSINFLEYFIHKRADILASFVPLCRMFIYLSTHKHICMYVLISYISYYILYHKTCVYQDMILVSSQHAIIVRFTTSQHQSICTVYMNTIILLQRHATLNLIYVFIL